MRSVIFIFIIQYCFSGYIWGTPSTYSVTLIKELESKEDCNRIVWINFPIFKNYLYVESPKVKKDILKYLENPDTKSKYLKLSELNLNFIGIEERTIQYILYDQVYYSLLIKINSIQGSFSLRVERTNENKYNQAVSIAGFRKGTLIVDYHDNLDLIKVLPLEFMKGKKLFLVVETIKSVSKRKIYNPPPFKEYVLGIPIPVDITEIKKSLVKKISRVIVNMHTDIYWTTDKLNFLSGRKKYKNFLREKIRKWGFDYSGQSQFYSFRTNFFLLGKNKTHPPIP